MCEYSGRLIAWLDHELPDEEATNVEWHVGQCAECRKAVSAYEEVTRAFLGCFEAAKPARPNRHPWYWAAAAAAILLAIAFVPLRVERLPVQPRATLHAPAMAFAPPMAYERPPAPIVTVHARRAPAPIRRPWIPNEPMVEVALPADALFPPGAVPEGFSFIADVRFQQ
jgi:hypothetical protein